MEILDSKIYSRPSESKNDFNVWADFVELLCWICPDEYLSKDSILDFFQDSDESLTDGKIDKVEAHLSDVFDFLIHRSIVYNDFYPFKVTRDEIELDRPLSKKQQSYLFLLFSSSLAYLDKKASKFFTDGFEHLSLVALTEKVGPNFNLNYFGAGAGIKSIFAKDTTFPKKLTKLSKSLGIGIKPDFDLETTSTSGDRGLDIVGWNIFDHHTKSVVMISAQVTCMEKWDHKAHECAYGRWKNILDLRVTPVPLIFLPRSVRKKDLKAIDLYKVEESILIDRYVLIQTLSDKSISLIAKKYEQCEYELYYPILSIA